MTDGRREAPQGSDPSAPQPHPPVPPLTSAQGPANQRQLSSQGPKLQARMSAGRLPGAQLCAEAPAPASAGPVSWTSPLPRQTTVRRWIPVPHSAEH